MNTKEQYLRWYENCSAEEREQLDLIANDESEIQRRFGSFITFGTAGLRGFMEAGTNSMNDTTVALATQAICDLIKQISREDDGVVIAYDSRNNSERFAKVTAEVCAANGVATYIFDALRPTPELSFAIRELGCVAGVNITASHNPKEYNGYKAYWEDGAQLPPEHANTVAKRMSEIDLFTGPMRLDFDSAVSDGKINVIGKEIDERYLECVLNERVYPEAVLSEADELKVVYSPLHGAGRILVPEVLRRAGIKHLYPVEEQMIADGNFPTVKKPNPEYAEVFNIGITIADRVGSDLIVATDPDADRVGVMIRNGEGKFITITGNQMGAMLLEYILSAYEETGRVPNDPYAVKTIVTTPLAQAVCEAHGVRMYNVLTGFKFIGEVIKQEEASDKNSHFVFGFEESYGYLKGTYARDKDSVVASMLIVEMLAYYQKKGMTLFDALQDLYDKYGYFLERTAELVMAGADGPAKMTALMKKLRDHTPTSLAGKEIVRVADYLVDTITDKQTGEVKPTGLPFSNVLAFTLTGGDTVVIRPSGTEPKVKIYYMLKGSDLASTEQSLASYKEAFDALVNE